MKRRSWPTIRSRLRILKNGSFRKDWAVDCGMLDGKRRVEYCLTQESAENRAQEIRNEHDRVGAMAFAMTAEQRHDAAEALKLLPGGVKLADAVSFYLAHNTIEQRTVRTLYDELLARAERKGLRPSSISELRLKLAAFVERHGETPVSHIFQHDIEQWLRDQHFNSPVSECHAIRVLNTMFNLAVKRGYLQKSPVSTTEKPAIPKRKVVFLSPAEVESLLRKAEEEDPAIIPKLAIGLFAGIRPKELELLQWSHISFENRLITIDENISKIHQTRHVTMEENLFQWLQEYVRFGKLGFGRRMSYKHLSDLREKAGITTWGPDILRHTFATMHLASGQDAAKTAFELGHIRGLNVLYGHYRGLTTKAEADRFWNIKPKNTVTEGAAQWAG